MENVPAHLTEIPSEALCTVIPRPASDLQPPEHRISCHRCGNIRKRRLLCSRKTCPHIFCGRCCDKMKDEYGPDIFLDGCPVCKDLCCCSNKSISCLRVNHCYRKCPASKNKAACTAYKEEVVSNYSEPPTVFMAEKSCGILDLLAAVADNQLNEIALAKRKPADVKVEVASESPVHSLSLGASLSADSKYTDATEDQPPAKKVAIELDAPSSVINSPNPVTPTSSRYSLLGGELAVPVATVVPSLSSSSVAPTSTSRVDVNPIIKSEIALLFPGTNFRSALPTPEDSYLHELNGIDGFVVNQRAAPMLSYSFLTQPLGLSTSSTLGNTLSTFPISSINLGPPAAPALTRRIPFAGTDFPAVRTPKSFDVIQRPCNPQSGTHIGTGGGNVVSSTGTKEHNFNLKAPDLKSVDTDSSLIYSGSGTNPINILALVSSYSSNIGSSCSSGGINNNSSNQ